MLLDSTIIKKIPSAENMSGTCSDFAESVLDGGTLAEQYEVFAKKGMDRGDVLRAVAGCLDSGCLDVEFEARSDVLKKVIGGGEEAEEICRGNPHMWNVVAYEKEWKDFADFNDFMQKGSPVYNKKQYQWKVYEGLLGKELGVLGAGSRVLDIGGGTGRIGLRLAEKGCDVTLIDASPAALKAAWRELAAAGADFDIAWADAADLSFIENGSMDAAFSMEVYCYIREPEVALSEAVRCVRSGGTVSFSVENGLGAILADPYVEIKDMPKILSENRMLVEGDVCVDYIPVSRLRGMSVKSGLTDVRIEGCHYIADGFIGKRFSDRLFGAGPASDFMIEMEKGMKRIPVLKHLCRAWLVTGTVK
ncbi:MAG TPA: class I SAM-dependent methyltransferase [bacterium]|nr:class I SAM-dependent methyltransferase [bacterium]